MSTELLLDKTKRLEMDDLITQIETLNNEVKKLRSRSIDLETNIDSQLNDKMDRQHREIHNQKVLPLIKSFDLSYDHPLVVQDIWPNNLWPEKPLEARHDFMMSDSEEEFNYVCIQKGILKCNFFYLKQLSLVISKAGEQAFMDPKFQSYKVPDHDSPLTPDFDSSSDDDHADNMAMVKGVFIESDGLLVEYGSTTTLQNINKKAMPAPWESLLQKNKLTKQKSVQINRSHTTTKRSSTEPLLSNYQSDSSLADDESDG